MRGADHQGRTDVVAQQTGRTSTRDWANLNILTFRLEKGEGVTNRNLRNWSKRGPCFFFTCAGGTSWTKSGEGEGGRAFQRKHSAEERPAS